MAGVKALRKLQMGVETTAGTAVVATALWRGLGTLEDQREVVHVDEDVGYLSKIDRVYTPKLLAGLTMDDTEATYEQLPYVLAAGVENIVTGVADTTGGSGKLYEYNFPTTAARSTSTYTIEGGDDNQAWEMEYAFVKGFTLSGVPGEAWKVTADWVGRQLTKCSFTTSITPPTVEEILFSKTKLYIDTVGGTMGTTVKASTLLGATLTVDTGLREVFTGDGQLYFTFTKEVGPEITLDVTFEHDSTAVAEIDAFRAETPRMIRLLAEGATLTTAGTFSKKTLRIDVAGKWESFEKLGETDGNDIVTGTMRVRYDVTAGKYCDILVVNQLTALT